MDSEQLKVFLAVVQQGSFGRVAEERYSKSSFTADFPIGKRNWSKIIYPYY